MSLIEIKVAIPEDNKGSEPAINTETGEPYLFGKALARSIRDHLIDEGLTTVGHIHDTYETSYKWKGVDYTRIERTLALKVDAENKDAIIDAIEEMHPYETISITTTNVEALSRGYKDWVAQEEVDVPNPQG